MRFEGIGAGVLIPVAGPEGGQSVDSDFLSLDKAMTIGYNVRMEPDCRGCLQTQRFAGVLQLSDCSDNESVEGASERRALAWHAGQSRPLTLKIAGTK